MIQDNKFFKQRSANLIATEYDDITTYLKKFLQRIEQGFLAVWFDEEPLPILTQLEIELGHVCGAIILKKNENIFIAMQFAQLVYELFQLIKFKKIDEGFKAFYDAEQKITEIIQKNNTID